MPETAYSCINADAGQSQLLQVYGESIKQVQDFKYLGSTMASSSNDLKRRKALAWTAFWKLQHLWRSTGMRPVSTKLKLFKASCVTILLYGCESWVISMDMESKINSFATSCYRILLEIKRLDRVSNDRVYEMTKTRPLIEQVRTRQLKFLGHILRKSEDEPANLYTLYFPTHGRRRPGRQRTSYLRYIQRLLGDDDGQLTSKQITDLAIDRKGWRKLTVACGAACR